MIWVIAISTFLVLLVWGHSSACRCDCIVLILLISYGEMSARTLSRLGRYSYSAVYTALDRLERRGLIAARSVPTDRPARRERPERLYRVLVP